MAAPIKASLHIKVYTDEALQILKSLEAAHLIDIDEEETPPPAKATKKLSERLYGILTPEQGNDLELHVKKMREEWDRI